jgi:hypothetical protein
MTALTRHRQRESRRAHERSKSPGEVMRSPGDDEIPDQSEPGCGKCTSAPPASGVEKEFRVFLHLLRLLTIPSPKQRDQSSVRANRAVPLSGVGGRKMFHARFGLRRARLARA